LKFTVAGEVKLKEVTFKPEGSKDVASTTCDAVEANTAGQLVPPGVPCSFEVAIRRPKPSYRLQRVVA
jgi:hypothetical protein